MSGGIPHDRFHNLQDDYFDCVICQQVVISPKMCTTCSNLFCKSCIAEWQKKSTRCPFKCNANGVMTMGDVPVSILNLYEDLEVTCSRENCGMVQKLRDLMSHEMNCGVAKCFNVANCGNNAPYTIKDKPVCSEACFIIQTLAEDPDIAPEQLLGMLQNFVEKVKTYGDSSQSLMKLSWTSNAAGLKVMDSVIKNTSEPGGLFQSACTDQGFVGGLHYFEVEVPQSNKFPAKIGVTLSKDFDMERNGFSDLAFGYSFFTKGQLRNHSASMGNKYGKEIKDKTCTIGVIVNLSKGQIGFSIDGDFQGMAFETKELMNGPIYPAVSLRGGCTATLIYGKDLPNEAMFMDM